MDQVMNKGMTRRIKQRVETVLDEGKLVESEDYFSLYQQNNGNWKYKFKKGRRLEDLEEGELSENTQRLSGLTILEPNLQKKSRNEFQDGYENLVCFPNTLLSNTANLFQKKEEKKFRLTNEIQNENERQPNILENEEEEDYVMLPMRTLQDLYDYELYSPIMQTKYLSELPGSNITNFDFLELLTTIGIKGNLWNSYWKKPYRDYQMTIDRLSYKIL
ncbi:hypothetical protein O181_056861 [Austropuccinia psidii MF-1]|uniref:Uncharacterized protein n=1 Tax=Austropuccinia psidii MF-1 TaxID=1389203 RepID=A0A9Q3EE18_9BASI|nr:hypothetical protein [Austropuccinia psidii MF-1]